MSKKIKIICTGFAILMFIDCSSVTLTTRNATEPVMVGKLTHLDDVKKNAPVATNSSNIMGYSKSLRLDDLGYPTSMSGYIYDKNMKPVRIGSGICKIYAGRLVLN